MSPLTPMRTGEDAEASATRNSGVMAVIARSSGFTTPGYRMIRRGRGWVRNSYVVPHVETTRTSSVGDLATRAVVVHAFDGFTASVAGAFTCARRVSPSTGRIRDAAHAGMIAASVARIIAPTHTPMISCVRTTIGRCSR